MSQLKIFDGVEVRLKSSVEVTHFTIKLQFIIFIRFLLMFRRWIQLNDLIFPYDDFTQNKSTATEASFMSRKSHSTMPSSKNIKKWWATGNDSSSQGTDDKNNEKFGHK